MDSASQVSGGHGWIHKLGAIGAIVVPLFALFSFFTGDDTGETGAELIAYAEDNETELWLLQIFALAIPVLIGAFVASLWVRLGQATDVLRTLTAIGGTLFIAFTSTGLTLWAAPLLSSSELTTAGAEAYLGYDDVGWVLLGLGGVSIAMLIVGAALAALELGLVPRWAAWASVALGVVSLATVAAIGFFAWTLWLIAAGCFLWFRREGSARAAEAPHAR